jgi:hypothetical protein
MNQVRNVLQNRQESNIHSDIVDRASEGINQKLLNISAKVDRHAFSAAHAATSVGDIIGRLQQAIHVDDLGLLELRELTNSVISGLWMVEDVFRIASEDLQDVGDMVDSLGQPSH